MEDFELDIEAVEQEVSTQSIKQKRGKKIVTGDSVIKNPLRKERVIVRHIPVERGIWGNNPKHLFAGGIADTAVKVFVVPKLSSGQFVNILTDAEKTFLEDALGLEPNALSIYNKKENFWSDANPNGINQVRLGKDDTYLNLDNPEDYIRYKILLANKNFIAPSLEDLQDRKLATYQFVLIHEGSEEKIGKSKMTATMECYKEFGKIEEDKARLLTILEILDGRAYNDSTKIETLQNKCNEVIQRDAKAFLRVVTDSLLDTKVLLRQAVNLGVVSKRGDFYYYSNSNETIPLCGPNEEPVLAVAVKFLNLPRNQELLFSIQAKCK